MRISTSSESVVPALAGAISAASIQASSGWWLNSGPAVACSLLVLFALGTLAGAGHVGSPWRRATALWVGFMGGLTASLLAMGPGSLWPIVLAISTILTASTVAAASAVGWWCRSRLR